MSRINISILKWAINQASHWHGAFDPANRTEFNAKIDKAHKSLALIQEKLRPVKRKPRKKVIENLLGS